MSSGITVVVTTVPSRRDLLRRALESVYRQTLQPDAVVVSQDNDRLGAALNRQAGTECVRTPWVAYLDDDDELRPEHLFDLWWWGENTGSDLVFPWFDVVGGSDPFPHHEGKTWDNEHPTQIPVTFLARTEAIRSAGGWQQPATGQTDSEGNRAGEDYELTLRLCAAGAKIHHLPKRTWVWHHWHGNSSGLPSRIDWKVD